MNENIIARTDSVNSILNSRNALFSVRPDTVLKNGHIRDALVLTSPVIPDCRVTVYPEASFWSSSDAGIADSLTETFNSHLEFSDIQDFLNPDTIRATILPRVASVEHLRELQEQKLVTVQELDLVYTFVIPLPNVRNLPDCKASIRVSEDLLATAGITLAEAVSCAKRNAVEQMSFESMASALSGLVPTDNMEPGLYILSNQQRIHGSGILLAKEALQKAAEKLHAARMVVLPSSVHEVLCIPDGGMESAELLSMVCSINASVVEPEDRLTDNVYYFEDGQLEALVSVE